MRRLPIFLAAMALAVPAATRAAAAAAGARPNIVFVLADDKY